MRKSFLFFVIISVLLHILMLSVLNLKGPVQKKSEPISVSVIPKKKEPPLPAPKPEPKPEPKKPHEIIENTPLDEDLKTDIDQMAPVPKEGKQSETKKGDGGQEQKHETPIREIAPDNSDVDVPKVTEKNSTLTQEQKNSILNPKDIIKKYAEGGEDMQGQDHVSMQYVKLKYQSYFYKFARRLYNVWVYPEEAAMRGEHGTVEISFVIARDGMISSIKIVRSSGYPDLDREAVSALKKTAGVPLPESYELNFLKVDAYFKYVIGGGFVVY